MLLSEIAKLEYNDFKEKIKFLTYEELLKLLEFVDDVERIIEIRVMMKKLKDLECSSDYEI